MHSATATQPALLSRRRRAAGYGVVYLSFWRASPDQVIGFDRNRFYNYGRVRIAAFWSNSQQRLPQFAAALLLPSAGRQSVVQSPGQFSL